MDELMLMEYLKEKGMSERDFMDRFREFMSKRRDMREDTYRTSRNRGYHPEDFRSYDEWDRHITGDRNFGRNTRMSRERLPEHFDFSEARYVVSEMFHSDNGRKCYGEKYGMDKAKEVCERYRGFIPSTVTATDVYVAINAQYHDYANLFKSWFGDDIDHKVFESAIVFWFKDEDNPGSGKLVRYFEDR